MPGGGAGHPGEQHSKTLLTMGKKNTQKLRAALFTRAHPVRQENGTAEVGNVEMISHSPPTQANRK